MKNKESKAMQEIHEIRESIYLETKDLTPEEKAEQTNEAGMKLIKKHNLKTHQKV
jgi:hypothetical protein